MIFTTKASRPVWAAVLVLGLLRSPPVRADSLPEGFAQTPLARDITGATAMALAPDGRIFICEQTGALRVVKAGMLLPKPFVTLTVDSSWERGLIGVALDPHFAANGYVYVNYIPPKPFPHHRISRFTAAGDAAAAGSEVILFEGDNQEKMGGGVKNGHQGGAIHFGPDGKLYVAIGDQTAGVPAQAMNTLLGKIVRLNPDGSIPTDNPFYRTAQGKYRAIWARGCRNPFTFAFQPGTGRMFINDVGGANEEINVGAAGANYGWPTADHGPTRDRRFRGPIHWYPESSIAGGAFYNPAKVQFPVRYVGKYFFGDFKQGWIRVLDPEHPADVNDFIAGLGNLSVVDIQIGADGTLNYLRRQAWVKDNVFRPRTGVLYQVRYTGRRTPPHVAADPESQTVLAGGAAYFRVSAGGSPPLKYQWQRDGAAIPGATAATYVLPRVSRADHRARFRCVVRNDFGEAVSNATKLTVSAPAEATEAGRFGDVFIRPRPGTYTGPITVRLTASAGDAVIRYTTDGTVPHNRSPVYSAPVRLERTTELKLQRFDQARPLGTPATAKFIIAGQRPYGLAALPAARCVTVPPVPELAPKRLSQTGLFTSLADLTPSPGVLPYTVNAPLWSDGAAKRRWIALPPGGRIHFEEHGEWSFPAGTVFVKQFELHTDETNAAIWRRLETRLLVVDGTGHGYGVTYRWRPDHSDADLLADALREDIPIKTANGSRTQRWYYPSRADCLTCHTGAAKFVLGAKTRQLNGDFTYPGGNTDNQLRTWNYLGVFDQPLDEARIPAYRRLAAVDDARAPLADRARSYLDANCASCHRQGNIIRATFDARYDTPLSRQGLVNAATVSDSLDVADPKVIAPGTPQRSMAFLRLLRHDKFQMPPLAVQVHDQAAIAVLRQWIEQLAPDAKVKRGRPAGGN